MYIQIKKHVHDNEIPDYLKECLDKLKLERDEHLVGDFDTVYELDDYSKRVFFSVRELHMECAYFKAWAVMQAYYGFQIEYDSKKKLFGIGGYETERITSKTLLGLIRKLEKHCK